MTDERKTKKQLPDALTAMRRQKSRQEKDAMEHTRIEEELYIRNQQYETFIENDLFGIWRVDFKQPVLTSFSQKEIAVAIFETGYIAECNDVLLAMYGFKSRNEFVGKPVKEISADRESFINRLMKVAENDFRAEMIDTEEVDSEGNIRYFRNSYFGHVHEQRLQWLWGFQIDITDHTRMEQALRESEEKHRNLFETMTQGVIYIAEDGKIVAANPAAERILGLTTEEILSRTAYDSKWKAIHEDGSDFLGETHPSMCALRSGQEVRDVVMGIYNPESEDYCWININSVPQYIQGKNQPFQVYTTFDDITSRKMEEDQIQRDLKEKKVLLKEIHYRVKNNLKIVCSLLSLQGDYIQDKNTRTIFNESLNRVRTIALVHEELYRSMDSVKISFKEYIETLVQYLCQVYNPEPLKIEICTHVEDVSFGIDLAVPCGLIINELISNALKHAFPPSFKGKGRIEITLHPKESSEIELIVKDNGVGISEKMSIHDKQTFGMQLVIILAEGQLKGKVFLERGEGTRFIIRFKNEYTPLDFQGI
jgi:PAS domain S-box-containing protein